MPNKTINWANTMMHIILGVTTISHPDQSVLDNFDLIIKVLKPYNTEFIVIPLITCHSIQSYKDHLLKP